jgi:hypothetical protein
MEIRLENLFEALRERDSLDTLFVRPTKSFHCADSGTLQVDWCVALGSRVAQGFSSQRFPQLMRPKLNLTLT